MDKSTLYMSLLVCLPPIALSLSVVPFQLEAADSDAQANSPGFRIQLDTLLQEYDGKQCWTQARAAAIPRPGKPPLTLVTMQKLLLTGSDIYYPINDVFSEDLGKTWSKPEEHADILGRRQEPYGIEVAPGDFWPKWHAASGKVLGIGQTFRYKDEKTPQLDAPKEVAYSYYDPATRKWAPWATLEAPEGVLSYQTAGGCAQRVDLPNGDILLPVYFKAKEDKFYKVKVIRCGFDGAKLKWLEEGNTLKLDKKRGFQEPSLTKFGNRYYLSIRHDDAGFVSTSDDGLHFGEPRFWRWDNGTTLGNYNTQTHWVSRQDRLYLVYTRRGADNDHVFRHRAPLFIAEVDTGKLAVKRDTEQILIPEKGARYGNFGICDVNENETWVVETEWMQRPPQEPIIPIENKWGAAGRVYISRILWDKPNLDWNRR